MAISRWLRSSLTGRAGLAGATLLGLIVLAAALAPIALTSPQRQDLAQRYVGFSAAHPMGTDQFGRDQLSRVLRGTRASLLVAIAVGALSGLGGGLIGLFSGYFGGRLDLVLQRLVDAVMSIPLIVLALALIVATPGSRMGVIVALSIGFAPLMIRVTRASALSLRQAAYAEAARAMGASAGAVLARHIVPNAAAPWIVLAGAQVGAAVLAESSLSFLGFGAPVAQPSLGALLGGEVQSSIQRAPWLVVWPGLVIALLVLGVNLVADALADGLTATDRRRR